MQLLREIKYTIDKVLHVGGISNEIDLFKKWAKFVIKIFIVNSVENW